MEEQLEIIIADRYRLERSVGRGGFGQVFEGLDLITNTTVALKAEVLSVDNSIQREFNLYKSLGRKSGVPKVYEFLKKQDDYRVIVFELLGPSLTDLHNFCGNQFSLKTTLLLADQLIVRIKNLHNKLHLHRDIKPSNMLMGSGRSKHTLYLADLGLAAPYDPDYEEPPDSNEETEDAPVHTPAVAPIVAPQGSLLAFRGSRDESGEIPIGSDEPSAGAGGEEEEVRRDEHMGEADDQNENEEEEESDDPARIPFLGTPFFASANAHARRQQTPKDEMWCVLYVLIYLRTGTLPWIHLASPCRTAEQHRRMYRAKKDITSDELCRGMPQQFRDYANYLLLLGNGDVDYDKLRRWMASCLRKNNFQHDISFDWTERLFWIHEAQQNEARDRQRERRARVLEERARHREERARRRLRHRAGAARQ